MKGSPPGGGGFTVDVNAAHLIKAEKVESKTCLPVLPANPSINLKSIPLLLKQKLTVVILGERQA